MGKRAKAKNGDEMLPEYDFSRGTRGKHAQQYQRGHTVTVHKTDGTTLVQHVKLEEGAVVLAPDVRKYFSDSDSVNQALRVLIGLIPQKPRRTSALSGRFINGEAAKRTVGPAPTA
jgi:hypothetical protein